jgi:excisionase family DNA binding protein
MSDEQFYTPREFAKLIKFSEVGVRRWIAERRIGVVHFGRQIRIPRSELQRLFQLGYTPAVRER